MLLSKVVNEYSFQLNIRSNEHSFRNKYSLETNEYSLNHLERIFEYSVY